MIFLHFVKRRNIIKINFEKNLRKIWILIFCAVSLVACIFFVPYTVYGYKDHPTGEIVYINALSKQSDYFWKNHYINYSSMAFRELLILVGCFGGYTLTTMIRKSETS